MDRGHDRSAVALGNIVDSVETEDDEVSESAKKVKSTHV